MRKKKTVVIEKTERRTPNGQLISETTKRTVFFNGVPVDESVPGVIAPMVVQNPVQVAPCRHSMVSRDDVSEADSCDLRNIHDRADYFDNWNTAVVREARVLRAPSVASTNDNPNRRNLTDRLYSKINDARRANDVPSLQPTSILAAKAEDIALEIALDGKLRPGSGHGRFNLWIGPEPVNQFAVGSTAAKIVDTWNREMRHWHRHYFECAGAQAVGIAVIASQNPHRDHYSPRNIIVVAMYD
uniref:SCP domain-containing protein n=1 Tax=Panagrellus redivivus TaxID=6233 RepID=A0A7E4VLH0_PANRE